MPLKKKGRIQGIGLVLSMPKDLRGWKRVMPEADFDFTKIDTCSLIDEDPKSKKDLKRIKKG